ncbi:MAG: prenyltransferase, partial [Spirochaetota bacterium]
TCPLLNFLYSIYGLGMNLRQFFGIVELRTKIVSLSTFFISLLYVLWRQGQVSPLRASLVCAAALAVDMGTTGFNSYFDWYRNVDDKRFNREDGKVIIHEGVPPGAALVASLGCYAVAIVLGIILTMLAGPFVLALGSLSMLVGFLYSGGPRPISSTPAGELFAGGFLGSAFFLINVYILTSNVAPSDFLASLPQSLFIGAILSTNNACDIEGDKAAGRRTLAIVSGKKMAPWLVYMQLAAGVLLLAVLGVSGQLPTAVAVSTIPASAMAFKLLREMHIRGYRHESKEASMGGISKVFTVMSAAQGVGLVVGIIGTMQG